MASTIASRRNFEGPSLPLMASHLVLILMILLSASAADLLAQVNVYTRGYDTARTGANLNETTLTKANVNASTFGKLFSVPTDGQVYAQPLYVSNLAIAGGTHNVVFVATMLNSVYALDADTGAPLWVKNFGQPIAPKEVQTNTNIAWNTGVGILGTPVIDPATNTMYFVSGFEKVVNGTNVYERHLNAISILTGETMGGSPVNITATYSTPDLIAPLVFDPKRQNQRPALALANHRVYLAFASHDDIQPYHGWVLAYDISTLRQTAVFADTTIGIEGGIWNAGGGPAVDASGNLYVSTGNGSFGKTVNGLVQTGNSFIKLSPDLRLMDYFTPSNSATLNAGDQDLGASGLLLLPNTNYVLGGGKQGVLYLVDTNAMGEFNSSSDQVRQEFQAVYGRGTSHIHGAPVYFNSAVNGPSVYVWGENDVLRGYAFNESTGLLSTTPFAKSTMTAPVTNNNGAMPGGFVSVSANGTKDAIVWGSTPYNDDAVMRPVQGVLYAFDAETLQLLWSDKLQDSRDEIGRFAKYCPPLVANGKVYMATFGPLGTTDGSGGLVVYGLLPTLTIRVADVTAPQGAPIPPLTGTVSGLVNGDTVGGSVVVSYGTTASSTSDPGTYPITARTSGKSALNYHNVVIPGTLTLTPPSGGTTPPTGGTTIAYNNGFANSSLQLNGSAQVSGTRLRLTSGGTYQAGSAFYPTPQNVQSFTNDFTFQLTNAAADGFTMVLQNAGPRSVGSYGINLGYGAPGGGIPHSIAIKFDIYNNGGEGANSTGLYVNGATPTLPATNLAASGLTLSSGHFFKAHVVYDGANLSVALTDTVTGLINTQTYPVDIPGTLGGPMGYIGFTAGTGLLTATQDILTWVYTGQPAPSGGLNLEPLSLNGGATLDGSTLRVLDGKAYEARSAFLRTPVNVQQFTSTFNFQLTNPAADGFAFVLQNVGPYALGGFGGSLGFGPSRVGEKDGIQPSVALKFDLYNNAGEGGNSTGLYVNGVSPFLPSVNLTGTGIDLHSGHPFSAKVTYTNPTLSVTITDGITQAQATQAYQIDLGSVLGSTAYAGFAGGTGAAVTTANITSWTYTAGSVTKPRYVFATPALAATSSGPTFRTFAWNGFVGRIGTILDSTAAGDYVTFVVNVPQAGNYALAVSTEQAPDRATFQLRVDGLDTGAPGDEYGPSPNGVLTTFNLGTLNLNAGNHSFTFRVAGRNSSATDGKLSFGQIVLTGQ